MIKTLVMLDTLDGFRFHTRFGPYLIKVEARVAPEDGPTTESGILGPSQGQHGPIKQFSIKFGLQELSNQSFWQTLGEDCKKHIEDDDNATGALHRTYRG
jgi:hypothetical protein